MIKTENEHLFPSGGLTLPYEVAHGITLASLIDSRDYMQSELDQWNANPKDELNPDGYWLHPDDKNESYIARIVIIAALQLSSIR